jgi:hypothetical protein
VQAALALLDYIEQETSVRVLVRESPVMSQSDASPRCSTSRIRSSTSWARVQVRGYDPKLAELYSQALVGMVALTGRWWLEVRKPRKETVAAPGRGLDGLSHLDRRPADPQGRGPVLPCATPGWADMWCDGVSALDRALPRRNHLPQRLGRAAFATQPGEHQRGTRMKPHRWT